MVMSIQTVLEMIQKHEVKFVDMRFTDTLGKEQHVSVPVSQVTEQFLSEGKMFDGSSIAGWQGINDSDMILLADPDTAVLDPFREDVTLNLICDIHNPSTLQNYTKDPRSLARRAEQFLKSTGIADTAYFGPEPEFFILDDVRWKIGMNGAFYAIDSNEAAWNSERSEQGGNLGHRPSVKGGYFPVPPVDSSQDLRSEICLTLEQMGLIVETHHHEVATANQCEIGIQFNTLVKKADELQILKYVVHNVAHAYGKTATFMPKPLVGDNGSGMHCHISLAKDGRNLFSGDGYAGLSETALFFMGGILKHAKALNAFTNATTNSYKRLVPGYEAPVYLAYSARNRSASIRIPYTTSPKARRIEIRFPDAATNPYFSFAAMLMAGIDGIKNQIHPGEPMDKDLYNLPPEEAAELSTVAANLQEALDCLQKDHQFLKEGGVFTDDLIQSYIKLKQEEVLRLAMTTHPIEFEMYYSL
ncbi:glutamate--ammonia ligase [Candidatus Berkiella cookevillensis]|uniref:Glutamine synthetase n=2 Tax=Candidatus Berkiella cookevillensis TaxID=437022 RepID=A0AAE3HS56_9GAMM|nr:glutamate--ammonia ligase [Candidatus Berkiella cookevillensis]